MGDRSGSRRSGCIGADPVAGCADGRVAGGPGAGSGRRSLAGPDGGRGGARRRVVAGRVSAGFATLAA